MKLKDSGSYRIADMELSERPREKMASVGPSQLSNEELLAILLRVGMEGENAVEMAGRLIREFRGLRGLYQASYAELCARHGLGPAKAAQLLAAMELGKRIARVENAKPVIHSPQDVYDQVGYEMSLLEQEELWAIQMDTRNQVLSQEVIYRGSANASSVRVGELFKTAVRINATGIIIIHNHPSGDPSPSPEDVALTRAAIQAGKLLDVEVLDHIVIGQGMKYVSLKEKGLGFV
jgi:DNA repair protein RadC